MSISRKNHVACFIPPRHGYRFGTKSGKFFRTACASEGWLVVIKHRVFRGSADLISLDRLVFPTFAEARKWAIDRLNELTEET